MAPFDPEDPLNHPVDFMLVQNGFVTKFWRRSLLYETTQWLTEHGYRVVILDASGWNDKDMHRYIAEALEFPRYYGKNSAALNDCLSDVACGDYGLDPSMTGLVLVLLHYDAFCRREPAMAHGLADTFAYQARMAALFGHRMLLLLQSDDPDLELDDVGATSVEWDTPESLNSSRHPGTH